MEIMLRSYVILVFCATLLIPNNCQTDIRSPKNHVSLFIFGDSLFDAGNNNYLKHAAFRSNFFPYGQTFFKHPTGRFSNGRLIPDFIAEYLKLPLLPPYLQPGNQNYTHGVNFASAGAGALAETRQGLVINLNTQLSYFKDVEKKLRQQLGNEATYKLISKALYLFSVGGNDYFAMLTSNSTVFHSFSKEDFVGIVIRNLTTVIKEIYKKGGRRFGFTNVGPYGCAPDARVLNSSGGCLEQATALIKLHNKALPKVLEDLKGELKGFDYSVLDFYTALSKRMDQPSKYGFKVGKVACCGSGPFRGILKCGERNEYELCDDTTEHVFFDSAHLTDKAHNQLAKLMWSGSTDVTSPCNLNTLLMA